MIIVVVPVGLGMREMPNCSQLPQWVSYLQALTVPVIAILGAWIAARQMLIAHDKFQLDAFERQYDKRFAVYEATRQILGDVFRDISEDDIREYALVMLSAEFLFDGDLWKYLKELHWRLSALKSAELKVASLSSSHEKVEFDRIKREQLNWIIEQGDEKSGFSVKFMPFLVHTQTKRAWWLRWP